MSEIVYVVSRDRGRRKKQGKLKGKKQRASGPRTRDRGAPVHQVSATPPAATVDTTQMARLGRLARRFLLSSSLEQAPPTIFAPLGSGESRGAACTPYAAQDRRDRVELRDLAFHAFHGVMPEERKLGQIFHVDVTLYGDLRKAGASDNLEDTTDYVQVFKQVKEVMEGDPVNLIEHLAERIANDVLREHANVEGVDVEELS